jgi:hypothetical protein
MAVTSGSSAGGSMNDFRKMGKASMEAELSMGAGDSTATDVVSAIGGVLNTKGAAMNADIKKRYNEKQKSVDEFGKKLELAFIDMGPEMENLGQESYQKANDDVFGLREAWADCEGLGDPAAIKKCQADIMVKLNTTKTRHSTDAENAKNLVGLWQGELDEDGNRGEPSADVKAMSDDDAGIMEQFVSNKSKRVVYLNEDGSGPGDILNYAWEVPVLDTDENSPTFGEQLIDPNTGQPKVETKAYSNDYLQELIPIKETVNGEKLQDYIEAEKQKVQNGQSPADNAALKKAIGDMIPKTQQALRSWAKSNPAAQDYLNVFEYLVDHPILDGQYLKLGLEDQPTEPNPNYVEGGSEPEFIGDGVINHEDFIAMEDKKAIIDKIMNADDVNLSHEILTDIYASVSSNEIKGLPKRARGTEGVGNIEYHPDRNKLSNASNKQVVAEHNQKKREKFYTMLSTDEGKESLNYMTENEIIEKYGPFTDDEIKNGVLIGGKRVNIDSFIAGPKKKVASGDMSKYDKGE